jgi:ethanolamine ammonia-lyase small subunit
MSSPSRVAPDPWIDLRNHTAARIALGRAGGSLPTREVLSFAADHAAARDAVHAALDVDALEADVKRLGLDCIRLASKATGDRALYLQRPDLGRQLDDKSRAVLAGLASPAGSVDLALIVSDGLSAPAAQRQVPPLLETLLPLLRDAGLRLSPVFMVRDARVALQDEIGQLVGAEAALILLGERPGLGTPDSLGAYLVFAPKPGRTDAQRNCVSNIHPRGLSFAAAAGTLHYLVTESLRRRLSGIALKDERGTLSQPPAAGAIPQKT